MILLRILREEQTACFVFGTSLLT